MEVHEVNQTQVSHMVQVRTEGPEVPEAARPERACGAKLAKLQSTIFFGIATSFFNLS